MTLLLLFALWGGTGVQAQDDNQHAFDQVLKKVDDLLAAKNKEIMTV